MVQVRLSLSGTASDITYLTGHNPSQLDPPIVPKDAGNPYQILILRWLFFVAQMMTFSPTELIRLKGPTA